MTTQFPVIPQTITEAQFFDLVMDMEKRGTTFVSFVATTDARLLKTGNPFGNCTKRSVVNGMIGYDYENSVNNQRVREAKAAGVEPEKFEAEARQWGTRLNRAFVIHKGQLYLTVKVERTLEEPRYFDEKGNELTKDQVAPFLPKKSSSSRQGVEKEIIARDYSLRNFDLVSLNKQNYIILH